MFSVKWLNDDVCALRYCSSVTRVSVNTTPQGNFYVKIITAVLFFTPVLHIWISYAVREDSLDDLSLTNVVTCTDDGSGDNSLRWD